MQTMARFELSFMHGGGPANVIGVPEALNGVSLLVERPKTIHDTRTTLLILQVLLYSCPMYVVGVIVGSRRLGLGATYRAS